jgi:type IV pilus biogenesis protein CpaD/CtpE
MTRAPGWIYIVLMACAPGLAGCASRAEGTTPAAPTGLTGPFDEEIAHA